MRKPYATGTHQKKRVTAHRGTTTSKAVFCVTHDATKHEKRNNATKKENRGGPRQECVWTQMLLLDLREGGED